MYLALRTAKRNSYAGEDLPFTATIASEDEKACEARLEVEVVAPDGHVLYSADCEARISCGTTELMSESLGTANLSGLCTLRGRLLCGKDVVTENAYEFRVVPRADIPALSVGVALVDPWGKLAAALDTLGIRHEPFGADTGKDVTVLVDAQALHWNKGDVPEAAALLPDFIKGGGTAVYLRIPPGKPLGSWVGNQCLAAPWLPFQLLLRPTRGLWSPFPHILREHPVMSRGLPAGKAMDRDYVNVYPHLSILNAVDGDPVVQQVGNDLWSHAVEDARRAPACTLGLGWRPGVFIDDRDYRGSGPVILGLDLIDKPCGDGTVVLSTLRLIDSIGQDPIADLLLTNIIQWSGG